jgi:hypothetical protein
MIALLDPVLEIRRREDPRVPHPNQLVSLGKYHSKFPPFVQRMREHGITAELNKSLSNAGQPPIAEGL